MSIKPAVEKEKPETSKKVVVVEEVEEARKETPSTKVEAEENKEKPKTGSLLWIIIPTTLLVGALAGGMITYFSGVSKIDLSDEPTPIATISPDVDETSTPEPETSLKREDLKVQVLNGSGTAGVAGRARGVLEELGYVDVAVGNAKSSDFESTEISITKNKTEYLDMLINDLSDKYSIDTETATLSATSVYDAVITLGSK